MASDGLTLEIDVSEIEELNKQFPEYQDIVLDESEVAMVSSLFMFQELIQGNTPVGATGNLRQDFQASKPITRGQSIEGSAVSSLVYGLPIERGRTPGGKMPPIDAIEFWVRRKLGVTKNSRGVAFVIARSIAKKGFRRKDGYRMVEIAFDEGSPKAIKLFDLALQKAAKKIEKKIEAID